VITTGLRNRRSNHVIEFRVRIDVRVVNASQDGGGRNASLRASSTVFPLTLGKQETEFASRFHSEPYRFLAYRGWAEQGPGV
jgi:hypothetical protein